MNWRDEQARGIGRRWKNRRLENGGLVADTDYEQGVDIWVLYQMECERIKSRLRALGFEGEDIWELAEAAAGKFEQLNGLHAAGRLTIT